MAKNEKTTTETQAFREALDKALESDVGEAARANAEEKSAYAELWEVVCDLLEPIVRTLAEGDRKDWDALHQAGAPAHWRSMQSIGQKDGWNWNPPKDLEAVTAWLDFVAARSGHRRQSAQAARANAARFRATAAQWRAELDAEKSRVAPASAESLS